ncbi:MAG: ABC transporter ATP-binding protein [Candidatus Coatesbacteria bacterium]|nr:ABC transporter ATP-binding protein [Candidatus Coatesbacteria bacterium]
MIRIQGITKIYQLGDEEVHALRGIDLEINQNEYLAIMGPSGSGKSTLMHILGCLDVPTSGLYDFEGRNIAEMDGNELAEIRNQKIGFVFQNFNLLSQSSAYENVELPLVYAGMSSGKRSNRVMEVINQVGLTDRADHKPNQLSGGQRQRVAIARAMVNKPSIILADEPTGNLDSKTSYEIMKLIKDIHDLGNTIIMVTHEEDIARFCHRIVRLRDGVILSDTKQVPENVPV